jgi:nucleoside phosphorylase
MTLTYTLSYINKYNVVIVYLLAGRIGTNSAAAVIVEMKSKFAWIRFVLMVGIGGGVLRAESDIQLRDVVISQLYIQHRGVV